MQGLFDFPLTTSGFSTHVGNRLSVQAFTGYKKVLLLQTGGDYEGLFGPTTNLTSYSSTDGTLSGFDGSPALVCSGGVLDELGPLNSVAVVTNGVDGWFVVGGSCGVAILADERGHGWDATGGLGYQFKGLLPTMAWRKISDAPVRKLIALGTSLFVLTTRSFERIDHYCSVSCKPSVNLLTQLDDELSSYSDMLGIGSLSPYSYQSGIVSFRKLC